METIRQQVKKHGLDAPAAFWATDDATLAMITGGCGPGRFGNFGWFDNMLGVNVKAACTVHDFEYCIGTTKKAKDAADKRMLDNMLTIINKKSESAILRWLRSYMATSYYRAVADKGWNSFVKATIVDSEKFTRGAIWYDIALAEMQNGVEEMPGGNHNERILQYHESTTLAAKTDETPWCSSFVNWCMERAGVSRTHKANARSWLSWGVPMDEPRIGCVVVFKRGLKRWQGHVGFYAGPSGENGVLCLGGNQKNKIDISTYSKSAVLGYRWAELKQS